MNFELRGSSAVEQSPVSRQLFIERWIEKFRDNGETPLGQYRGNFAGAESAVETRYRNTYIRKNMVVI